MVKTLVAGDRRRVTDASSFLFRRLPYMLSPQFDIYENLGPLVEGKRVLEIGFGTGLGTLQYGDSASMVDAIERDPAAVRFANRCFRLPNVTWIHSSIEDIPTPNDFEFVVMIEVLEHVEDADFAMHKVSGALKPGGHALITVPNRLRERREEDELIVQEWDSVEFKELLIGSFSDVRYLNYALRERPKIPATISTPLIALCS